MIKRITKEDLQGRPFAVKNWPVRFGKSGNLDVAWLGSNIQDDAHTGIFNIEIDGEMQLAIFFARKDHRDAFWREFGGEVAQIGA